VSCSQNCQEVLFLSINPSILHPAPLPSPRYFLWLSVLLLVILEGGLLHHHNLKTENRPLTLPSCWEHKTRRPEVCDGWSGLSWERTWTFGFFVLNLLKRHKASETFLGVIVSSNGLILVVMTAMQKLLL